MREKIRTVLGPGPRKMGPWTQVGPGWDPVRPGETVGPNPRKKGKGNWVDPVREKWDQKDLAGTQKGCKPR